MQGFQLTDRGIELLRRIAGAGREELEGERRAFVFENVGDVHGDAAAERKRDGVVRGRLFFRLGARLGGGSGVGSGGAKVLADWIGAGDYNRSRRMKRQFGIVAALAGLCVVLAAEPGARPERRPGGPGGGSPEKPVGCVWFAWQLANGISNTARYQFDGDRAMIRRQSVEVALVGLIDIIENSP